MLLCAANPGKIATLNEWLASHQTEKGSALQDAAAKAGFDASYVALVLFPDVVSTMAGQVDWTRQIWRGVRHGPHGGLRQHPAAPQPGAEGRDAQGLAAAGRRNEDHVVGSAGDRDRAGEPAGHLRAPVQPAGRLRPARRRPPSSCRRGSSSDAVAAGLIGFTAGIVIGAAIDNDYYYGPYGWGRRRATCTTTPGTTGTTTAKMRARIGWIIAKTSTRNAVTALKTRGNSGPIAPRRPRNSGPSGPTPVSRTARVAGPARAAAHRRAGESRNSLGHETPRRRGRRPSLAATAGPSARNPSAAAAGPMRSRDIPAASPHGPRATAASAAGAARAAQASADDRWQGGVVSQRATVHPARRP